MREHPRSVPVSHYLLVPFLLSSLYNDDRVVHQVPRLQRVFFQIWQAPRVVMLRARRASASIVLSLLFALIGGASVSAQTVQFLPEVDAHLKLTSRFRIYAEAKDDRDGGDPSQATIGPSIQMYVKPLLRLKRITTFDLDDAKPRALVLEAGYRYITAPDTPTDNRFLTSATFHLPLKGGALISDRNRADLDWKDGKFNWRYRNKITIERTFAIYSYHLIPYIAFEPYYTSQYEKWSTTSEFAGCLLPVGRHVEFNPYYEHENNTGKAPNKPTNSIGLAVYLFFSVERTPAPSPAATSRP